jgi:Flp pilus assembly protein TadG
MQDRPTSKVPARRRGVTVLEATLVLPVILALVFGTIEFAYVFYVKQTLQAASREGARRGVVAGATNAEVIQAVSGAMEDGGLGNCKYAITISNATTDASADVSTIPPGNGVRVEVTAPWTQFSVFLSGFGDWTRGELRSGTVMRRED